MTLVTLHRHIRHCFTTSILGPRVDQVCVCRSYYHLWWIRTTSVRQYLIWCQLCANGLWVAADARQLSSSSSSLALSISSVCLFFLLFTFSNEEQRVNLSFTYCTTGTKPNATSDEVVKFKRMDFTQNHDGPWVTGVSGSEHLKLTTAWQMKSWRLWRDSSIQWYVWLSAESLGVVKWQTGLVSTDLTLTL